MKYVKIRELMVEIEALRALVDDKRVDVSPEAQAEIEKLRSQLTDAQSKLNMLGERGKADKRDELIAELREQLQHLQNAKNDQ